MGFYFFSSMLIVMVYGFSYYNEDDYKFKQPIKGIFFFVSVALLIVYKIHLEFSSVFMLNLFVLFGVFLLLVLYKLPDFIKPSKNIIAKQSNFWGISPQEIIDKTEKKIVEKKDRREYTVDPLEVLRNDNFAEMEIGRKKLSQNFTVLHLKEYDNFTIKKDISIEKYMKSPDKKIFKVVFEKILEFIENKEVEVDLEEVFMQNKYCVEFFLMQLWEEHSLPFSYGIGTLQVYLYDKKGNKDEYAEAFLYALDGTRTTTINRKGFSLYYYYHFFKNREREL